MLVTGSSTAKPDGSVGGEGVSAGPPNRTQRHVGRGMARLRAPRRRPHHGNRGKQLWDWRAGEME